MYVKRFRFRNFSSFAQTEWVNLLPGINLIVGQNNVGKSAILRIFERIWSENFHRNSDKYRIEDRIPQEAAFEVCVSREELRRGILLNGRRFLWPVNTRYEEEKYKEGASAFLSQDTHVFEVMRTAGEQLVSMGQPLHREFLGPPNGSAQFDFVGDELVFRGIQQSPIDSCLLALNTLGGIKFFTFQAQRYGLGRSGFGREERLLPDARNLAGILSKMQGEQGTLFTKLISHLREVFPTVRNLSVTPRSGFEILVWPTEDCSREEFSFPLDDCGTGVAQVIAILTVAMTFEQAILVIDEINTFLHPAAAKALVRILRTEYSAHQYIITTHSPDVLSSANPPTVNLVRKKDFSSVIEQVNLQKVDDLRDLANEIGVSMTDVFAAERIIWVEGPTEEICFPYIYKQRVGELPSGIVVSSIVATGDFNAKIKRRELIFQIYNRLSNAAAPLVKSAAFHFDRETLTDSEVEELIRHAAETRVAFLPRRHFECYLLNPAAIAAFINSYLPENENTVSDQDVHDGLCRIGGDRKYKADGNWNDDPSDPQWLSNVDAANLIKDICYELSDNRIAFSKNRHSFDILKRILESDPTSLDELTDYVKSLFEMVKPKAA